MQESPFIGHLVPGIALFLFGIILICLYDPEKNYPELKKQVTKYVGWVLVIIGVVFAVLLIVDMSTGVYDTKFHRVLSMMVFPLGMLMVRAEYDENNTRWKLFMPVFSWLNAMMYFGHQHHEDEDVMSNMPTAEEQAHQFFFICYLLSGWLFIFGFLFIYHKQLNTFFNAVACMFIVVVGIWYVVIAFVLYYGFFGRNGVNYNDSTADFGIVLLVTSSVFAFTWFALGHSVEDIDAVAASDPNHYKAF